MNFPDKGTISNNDGTLASFQGLCKWHISFNYPLICKERVCICAWRMTDSDWKKQKQKNQTNYRCYVRKGNSAKCFQS